jgi:glycosyltransferase involved in cell wall biosynthesis
MCKDLYTRAKELEEYCVINHVHADSATLRQYQQKAEFFIYPTNFNETYCISLTEAMAAGCIPITSNRAAPAERITEKNGFLVGDYEHDAYSPENRKLFIDTAVSALCIREDDLYDKRQEAIKTARKHDYSVIIPSLLSELTKRF